MKDELKIYCPFCNALYTANMVEELSSTEGCETCGWGSDPTGTVDIVCENCKKVVYRKEL